jgi:hypothetical protein
MRDMNRLIGSGGTVKKQHLKGHNVIIVSDGLETGFQLDLAIEFLKPINSRKNNSCSTVCKRKSSRQNACFGRRPLLSKRSFRLHKHQSLLRPEAKCQAKKIYIKAIDKIILNWR